jgi:hypothetical protein
MQNKETILLLFRRHNCLHTFNIHYVLITICFGLIGHPQAYAILTFTLLFRLQVLPTLASVYTVGVLVQVFRLC